MRAQDIEIDKFYRLKESPDYGWIKPIKILKPKELPNKNNHIVVKCEHTIFKNDSVGHIRYFRPRDICRY